MCTPMRRACGLAGVLVLVAGAALAGTGKVGSALGALRFWKPIGIVILALVGSWVAENYGIAAILRPLAFVQTAAVGVALLLHESRHEGEAPRGVVRPEGGRLPKDPGLWAFVAAMVLYHAANAPGGVYLGLFLKRDLHAPERMLAYAFAVSMVAWMLVVWPAGWLADRVGRLYDYVGWLGALPDVARVQNTIAIPGQDGKPRPKAQAIALLSGPREALPADLQAGLRRSVGQNIVVMTVRQLSAGDAEYDLRDDQVFATLDRALELEVTFWDTAPLYGHGRSEELIGAYIGHRRDEFFLASKCGCPLEAPADAPPPYPHDYRPANVRADLEQSLRRLRTERIDLFQMHWPPEDGSAIEEYWSALLALKEEGKVAAVGLSNHSAEQVAEAERFGHVDCVQPPLSLIVRDRAGDLIPMCQANGTGVIVYSPMQSGLLTGTFSAERVAALPANDWRARSEHFTGENLQRNLALAQALVPIAERHAVSPAAVAVAWTLAWPGVTGAIVGARGPQQVDTWLPAAGLAMTDTDLADLQSAIAATHAGSGPVCPTGRSGG